MFSRWQASPSYARPSAPAPVALDERSLDHLLGLLRDAQHEVDAMVVTLDELSRVLRAISAAADAQAAAPVGHEPPGLRRSVRGRAAA